MVSMQALTRKVSRQSRITQILSHWPPSEACKQHPKLNRSFIAPPQQVRARRMTEMKETDQCGFTILELLAAIAIMPVVGSVALPRVENGFRESRAQTRL